MEIRALNYALIAKHSSYACVFYFLSNVTMMHQPCQEWLVFTHLLLILV